MKKLFLLAFAGLLSLLFFVNPVLAEENHLSAEEEYTLLEASAAMPESVVADDRALKREEGRESSTGAKILPDDILTADCTTFYQAEDIVNIEEEDLYKKQSNLLKNLEFSKQSNFRLDPNEQSLNDLNGSFLQSNFIQERLAALDALQDQYTSSLTDCLKFQAQAIKDKTLLELEESRALDLQEIEDAATEALNKLEAKANSRQNKIERKRDKRLRKIKQEARTTQRNFRKRVNKAYSEVYSGKRPSLYNKTIITFEQKLDQLPAFVKSREQEVIRISEKALRKTGRNTLTAKTRINDKKEERIKSLTKQVNLKIKEAEDILKSTLKDIPRKSESQADSIYKTRKEAISNEEGIISERSKQGSEIINYLKNLWIQDRKKDLPRLDITALNLDSEEITVQGIMDPKASKQEKQTSKKQTQKESQKIKKSKAGKKSKSGGLTKPKTKPQTGKKKQRPANRDKDGSGDFVGNIDRIWNEHNSADGDWGGPTLPSYVVAALAQAAGMPGITMEQVTRGESGAHKKNSARPGATGVDPGGTKGYGLWMITTSFNDQLAKRVGGYKKFLNPVLNAWAAAQVYKSNGLRAWHGTGSVQGDGVHYKGKYDLRKALGGRTYKQVLASYGIGKN